LKSTVSLFAQDFCALYQLSGILVMHVALI